MTLWQLEEIFGHDRDKQGRLVIEGDDADRVTEQEMIIARWRKQGLTEKEADAKFVEFIEIETYRAGLEQERLQPSEIEARVATYAMDLARKRTWGR